MVGCHIIPYCFSSSYTLPSTKHPASTNTILNIYDFTRSWYKDKAYCFLAPWYSIFNADILHIYIAICSMFLNWCGILLFCILWGLVLRDQGDCLYDKSWCMESKRVRLYLTQHLFPKQRPLFPTLYLFICVWLWLILRPYPIQPGGVKNFNWIHRGAATLDTSSHRTGKMERAQCHHHITFF